MKTVAIIGAGIMGQGVAQTISEYAYRIILIDVNEKILQESLSAIKKRLFMNQMLEKKEKIDIKPILENIETNCDLSAIKKADIVIENITEDICAKEQLYKQMNHFLSHDAIIMINTSCISITKLASLITRPDRVIGVHFMNPVPQIAAVELIKGFHTSEPTITEAVEFIDSLKKESILVNDLPGFVSNRISHLMINEAAFIVQDQVATSKTVDDIFVKCYAHKMGPLQTADLIGLDTVVKSLDVLYKSYQDPKFRCCPLLKKMVDAGLLGQKSGQGFYEY